MPVALSGSPKLTVLPSRSPIDFTSFGAMTSIVSGARRATSGVALWPVRRVFDADGERVER